MNRPYMVGHGLPYGRAYIAGLPYGRANIAGLPYGRANIAGQAMAHGQRYRRYGVGDMSVTAPCNNPMSVPCAPMAPVCPEDVRRYWVSFTPQAGTTNPIAAGATGNFVLKPQVYFKPDRLFVPSTITPFFDIVQMTIGNRPQFAAAGATPSDIFSEVSTYSEMNFDPSQPGIDITLQVTNKSGASQTFQATLVGIALE